MMISTSPVTTQHSKSPLQTQQYKDLNENTSLAYNANVISANNHTDQQRSGNICKTVTAPSQTDKHCECFDVVSTIFVCNTYLLCINLMLVVSRVWQCWLFVHFHIMETYLYVTP